MTDESGHATGAICARLCLRRHGHVNTLEDALVGVRDHLCQAVKAAVEVAHAAGCEVEVDGDYWVAYPSVPKEAE